MSRRGEVLRSQLADAARRPARTLLTGLAMAVAAFVVFGTVLAHQVTERTLLAGLSGTPAAADLVVSGDVTTRTLDAARRVPGVAEAVGRTDAFYGFAGGTGGLSVYADPGTGPLATVRVTRGRYPGAADEIAVTRRTVERLGLAVGGTLRVTAGADPARSVPLTVVGVVAAPDDPGAAGYTTEAFAARLAGHDGLRQVELRLTPDAHPADIAVSAPGDGPLPAGLVERARADAGLDRVVPYRASPDVRVAGVAVEGLAAVDLDLRALATRADFGASAGSLADAGPGRVVLLRVAATMANTPVGAGLLLAPADLDRLGVPAAPTGLLADVAGDGGRARSAAVAALRAAGGPGVGIEVTADDRDDLAGDLRAVTAVLLSLLALTVVVAVVGVGTTTALSVVERTRESGLLRAVGMSRRRLAATLTVEAGLYGVVGATLGLLLALPYGWLTVAALGAGAPVEFPAGRLALVVLALAAATALAGLLPARRAARVGPVTALAAAD
ncbi:ABC transporter permease [Micromonospora okii]|uniref:ABC transporter permease n=1 Tax=Micromonospora okii TaxID=1182970 RepID=UPI001E40CFBC|nr:ABC transporter permease [Micromonospora okii]